MVTVVCLFLVQCSINKFVKGNEALHSHPQRLKVYSIGLWRPGVVVVTFIDADDKYFTVFKPSNDSLVKGRVVTYSD